MNHAEAPLDEPALWTDQAFEALNRECVCFSLDRDALARALDAEHGHTGLSSLLQERCPHVFAAQPVFVPPARIRQMRAVVRAVEAVVALPAYRDMVLDGAPETARIATGARSVFFGYDFHVAEATLGLIEINTNAGGAMLNAVLARAQRACCADMESLQPSAATIEGFERAIVRMFRDEWQAAGRTTPLRTLAIVDEAPTQQYLYPEFLLFQRLFERHGLQVVVADPSALELRGGRLWHEDCAIDLVYNRLTDFYLESARLATLRQAHLSGAAVLTPHPRAHALYADKRRLAVFSDADALRDLGVPAEARKVLLAHVPRTEPVDAMNAGRLWAARKSLFFKPTAGFGSRAAYRGDKLTRGAWSHILSGGYVAQALVTPGERWVATDAVRRALKYDLRAYAYDGAVQWLAARLYQGQTTNFRTVGGGFSPVFSEVQAASEPPVACHEFS